MIIIDLILALIIALILTSLLVPLGRFHSPRTGERGLIGFVFILFLLFVFTWAGGLWVAPFGPVIFGVTWMPFVLAGLILALILAAVLPRREPPRSEHFREGASEDKCNAVRREEHREAEEARVAIGLSFVVAVIALLLAIGAAYML